MADDIRSTILAHLQSAEYRPVKPRALARALDATDEHTYPPFRDALRAMMDEGKVVVGAAGTLMLPAPPAKKRAASAGGSDEFTGVYRQNKRGFGFVVPVEAGSREDLFIPPEENGGAITGDTVRAKTTSAEIRNGKDFSRGRITEILKRGQKRFVGSLAKQGTTWMVMPDGNTFTEPILTPDAAARHIKVGTKVVVEMTRYAENGERAQGVVTEVLGGAGEKDVDLKSVIVQFNLPESFPEAALEQARSAVERFNKLPDVAERVDLTEEVICTIDPDDAKDYDDAISLRELDNGYWELGVHIADVSFFVEPGSPLDVEARERGNSVYFPGFVIPMLPEVLSNGVCSLQEGVPRLCKSVFITLDDDARPVRSTFANTIINSKRRFRYREAQAILDGDSSIPHPDGPKTVRDYEPHIVQLLHDMNGLAKRIQQRRHHDGQLVLGLPEVHLVLDDEGKVVDAEPADTSFTHTLIEMFMVEANEAVARLLDSLNVPFLRRTHPTPDLEDTVKLRGFAETTGHKMPKELDRKALQKLLEDVKGKPEAFAVNLAVLRSLTRAEYSPNVIGHFALASEHYGHYTSPIRRYADLTIHRLLDAYFKARTQAGGSARPPGTPFVTRRKSAPKLKLADIPSHQDLVDLGKHLSFTERRAADAERELRQVKLLELLANHVGEDFPGVVTSVTNFGLFVQLDRWLIDGLIRYERLLDDWWDVDEKAGVARARRSGKVIGTGDMVTARVARVDPPRRELDLAIIKHTPRPGRLNSVVGGGMGSKKAAPKRPPAKRGKLEHSGGATARNQRSKQRGRGKR